MSIVIEQCDMVDWLSVQPCQPFQKFGTFKYKVANTNVTVDTFIDGKHETTNVTTPGDIIVTGPKGERFVLTAEKFQSRYKVIDDETCEAYGHFFGVKYEGDPITFIAPWGEQMICEDGDMLGSATPDLTECYRIEKNVFNQTYKLCEE